MNPISNALPNALPVAPLLSLQGLAVTYPNGHAALHPTHLGIEAGQFVVLLGASGAGKSTLLRSLNGLVKPSAGQLHVGDLGAALTRSRTLRAHRRLTGMVFQQHHLIGRQTVLGNVLLGCVAQRPAWASCLPWRHADKQRALAAIERVGLLDKALERADALSGGQQQRVGIARALVQQPRLMLADEPVASLDPATALSVLTLLHGICQGDGLTAVVSLHQVALARRFADRVIGLRQGRVVFDGPPAALDTQTEASLYADTRPTASLATQPAGALSPLEPTELTPC